MEHLPREPDQVRRCCTMCAKHKDMPAFMDRGRIRSGCNECLQKKRARDYHWRQRVEQAKVERNRDRDVACSSFQVQAQAPLAPQEAPSSSLHVYPSPAANQQAVAASIGVQKRTVLRQADRLLSSLDKCVLDECVINRVHDEEHTNPRTASPRFLGVDRGGQFCGRPEKDEQRRNARRLQQQQR